jgi:peptide/nickel transport system permease protein
LEALIASILLVVILAFALLGPDLIGQDPEAVSYELMRPPSAAHLLGTDDVGRDVLARLLIATRISLAIGLAIAGCAVSAGVLIGSLSGFFGGWIDRLGSGLMDLFLTLPILPVALVVAAFVPVTPVLIVGVFAALSWMSVARLVRAGVLALRERDFVTAARASGIGPARLLTRHILPNVADTVIVAATLLVATGILLEASLSYLGFGVQLPTPSLGNMLLNAQLYIYVAPWLAVFPGSVIFAIIISVNLLGDALRDYLDPRRELVGRP